MRGIVILLAVAAFAAAEDWPSARFTPANTGVSGNRGPVKTPAVAWKHEEKEPISRGVALASGKLVYGMGEFAIACRKAEDGAGLWESAVKQQITAWPAIFVDRVYVGSPDGVHYMKKLGDGKDNGAYEATAGIVADPVVNEDYYLAGSEDGLFYVMAPGRGILWKAKTGRVIRGCALDKGVAFVASEDGTLHALDLKRKEELWQYEGKAAPLCAPILSKGRVWLVVADAVTGVTRKGALGERRETKGIAGAPALDGTVLYYGTAGGEVVTLDLEGGKEIRRSKVAGEAVSTPLILAKGVLYGAAGKTLFAVDAKTGKTLWTFAGPEEPFQPPIVADGFLYVAAGRTFYCLK